MMHHTFISLGTNLGDRKENLHKARTLLQGETGQITAESSVYETEPWGFKHDQFFFNQVVSVQTNLNAFMLLKKLKGIETVMGRNNKLDEYSARIIDIDILFYDDMVIATDTLQLPHPLIEQRLFVLVPLNEIASLLVHPVRRQTIHQLLQMCPDKRKVVKTDR